MRIFVDFDDVLFNTRDFTSYLKEIFREFEISDELFHQTYEEVKMNTGGKDFSYNFENHVQILKSYLGFDATALLEKLQATIKDTSRFLFSDSLSFLESLKNQGHSILVLSFGDTDYQGRKIGGSGIEKFADGIIITQESKESALQKQQLRQNESAYFFDDRVHFLEGAKKIFPSLSTVLVSRPEGRYTDERNEFCDYQVFSLTEGKSVIENSL